MNRKDFRPNNSSYSMTEKDRAIIRKNTPKTRAWNVYKDGKFVDRVHYNGDISKEDVRKSLINHDNYDNNITLREHKKFLKESNTDKTVSSKYSVHEGNLVRKFDTKEQAEKFAKMDSSKWTKSNIELGLYEKSNKPTWFEQQPQAYQDKVKAEEHYYNTANSRYEKNLRGRAVLHSGHSDDLVEETPTKRVWVSRVTGEESTENLKNGKWTTE